MTTTAIWLFSSLGVVAILLALMREAKKFLDNDKDYLDKVEEVTTLNTANARTQLVWIGKDLTDAKSSLSLRTLDIEDILYPRVIRVVHCFQRTRWCRRAITNASMGLVCTLWSSIIGIILVLLFGVATWRSWASLYFQAIFVAAVISVALCIASFAYAEVWLQVIRTKSRQTKGTDAA